MTLETAINYYAFLIREAQKASLSKDPRTHAIKCVTNFRMTPQIADQVNALTIHRRGPLASRIASDVLLMCKILEREALISR